MRLRLKRVHWLGAGALSLAAVLWSCSRADDPSIIQGHWRAENFRLAGVTLPIAPEIDISATELAAQGVDARVRIKRMERDGDEVTLTLPVGVGLVFTFDGPDRMFIDVPLVGPVYYRRAGSTVAMAPAAPATPAAVAPLFTRPDVPPTLVQPTPTAVTVPLSPAPSSAEASAVSAVPVIPSEDVQTLVRVVSERMAGAELVGAAEALARAQRQHPADPTLAYLAASLEARRGRPDAAIDKLRQAVSLGFKDVPRMEHDAALASIRSDVRYRALLALVQ